MGDKVTLGAKLTADSTEFEKAFSTARKTADEFGKKIPDSMKNASQQTKKSLAEIAAESGKTVNQLRSDIMKSAAAYQKAGMTKSEAMRKAYADIGYAAEESGVKTRFSLEKTLAKLDEMGKKLQSVGKGFTSFGKSVEKIGDKLTKYITKPAIAAGAAVAGITLGKGWSRMSEIDNAKVKLEAIGNSAEDVTEIMNNATVSVKGTAYGLNEAATTAASAVAAGIQPGQELESYLTAIGDAAAVAGADMSSMGAIFNKVATQGKANNEVLQQMAEAGIPIYQYLADEIGTTAEAVFEMASDGEINLATFQRAVETHIGGAAKTIGSKTISGAISNIWASVSRIGANFLGSADDAKSFAGQVLPLLNDFKDYLGEVEEKAKEWGATFGQVFGAVVEYCRTGNVNFGELSESAANIMTNLVPIIDTVKSIASAFMNLSPSMQTGLITGILLAGPVLSVLGKISRGVGGIIETIGKVPGVIKGVGSILKWLVSPIGLTTIHIAALIAIGYLLISHWETVKLVATDVWNGIQGLFKMLDEYLTSVFTTDWTQNFGVLGNVLNGFFANASNIWNAVKRTFSGIIDFIAGIFTGNWSRAWKGVINIFGGIWDGLEAVAKAPLNGLISLVNAAIGGLNSISVTIPNWVPKYGGRSFGINIPTVPYLYHGTDNWQGGFAYMNEGGRGELTHLPDGTQVIPHDISEKYAKESARMNRSVEPVDFSRILEGMTILVDASTSVDGTPLKELAAEYTIRKIGNQQRAILRAKGAYA